LCVDVKTSRIVYRSEVDSNFVSMRKICYFFIDVKSARFVYRRDSYAYCVTKLILCILRNNVKIMRIEYRFDIYEICFNVNTLKILSMWKLWEKLSMWQIWQICIDEKCMWIYYLMENYASFFSWWEFQANNFSMWIRHEFCIEKFFAIVYRCEI